MSSIMCARSGLTGRCEGSEVIRGSFLEPKVAGPSMLGIGCPDRHALPRITSSKLRQPRRVLGRRPAVDFGKDGVEPSQTPEARPHRDLGHRQAGLVEEAFGSLNA